MKEVCILSGVFAGPFDLYDSLMSLLSPYFVSSMTSKFLLLNFSRLLCWRFKLKVTSGLFSHRRRYLWWPGVPFLSSLVDGVFVVTSISLKLLDMSNFAYSHRYLGIP